MIFFLLMLVSTFLFIRARYLEDTGQILPAGLAYCSALLGPLFVLRLFIYAGLGGTITVMAFILGAGLLMLSILVEYYHKYAIANSLLKHSFLVSVAGGFIATMFG